MKLKNKRIAMFLENKYEDLEFWYPCIRMKEEGAKVEIIAPEKAEYKGKHGLPAKSDKSVEDANPSDYDALIIPGGYSPDLMRRHEKMVDFVKKMNEEKKNIAAICHAGWMLASANIIKGKKLTSFYSIKDDMINAGADWIDKEVVKDGNIITSRNPNDLPAFCSKIIETLASE